MNASTSTASGESGGRAPRRLSAEEIRIRLGSLGERWTLVDEGAALVREVEVKGFAKAVYVANLAAFHADRERHHPDVSFGVGYCRVRYTTHDVGGLSELDFASAAAFDRLLEPPPPADARARD